MKRIWNFLLPVILSWGLLSCGGGSKPPPPPQPLLVIQSINLQPPEPSVGTVVEVTATYNNPSLAEGRPRLWEVSAGSLSTEPPDFSLLVRQTAGIKQTNASLSTTGDKVYWFTPTIPGSATIKLTVAGSKKQVSVTIKASSLVADVTPGDDGTTVVTVRAVSITNLYQAAFRLTFNSLRYKPVSVTPGSFLGGENEILFLGLTNQAGFVPVAITRKGNAPGVSGSGELAKIVFEPKEGSTSRSKFPSSILGFDISFFVLLDSQGNLIGG